MGEWNTAADLPAITHTLRTMSTFLKMAADDAERADPELTDDELQTLSNAADEVVKAVANVVNVESNYPVLGVLEARTGS